MPDQGDPGGIASIMCAVMFSRHLDRGSWRLPAVGVGLLVVAAIVVGGIYPAWSSASR